MSIRRAEITVHVAMATPAANRCCARQAASAVVAAAVIPPFRLCVDTFITLMYDRAMAAAHAEVPISRGKQRSAAVDSGGVDLVVRSSITVRTTAWLVSIRRTLITRGFAALLLVLTITPFTAPFATLDAAELLTEAGHPSLDSSVKPAKDLAAADLVPVPFFTVILQPFARPVDVIGPIHLQRLRTIVLRV